MSRSGKKHLFAGISTARSEKADKIQSHRRERRAVRQLLYIDPLSDVLPHRKQFGDSREFSKDGKLYLPRFAEQWPGLYGMLAPRLRK